MQAIIDRRDSLHTKQLREIHNCEKSFKRRNSESNGKKEERDLLKTDLVK